MHWIYVIECENNIIYVGETHRLFSRLKEHCKKHTGSVTTHSVVPKKLIGLFRLENIKKKEALDFENLITEMIMKEKKENFYKVFGGKYHVGFRPQTHPSDKKEFSRPYCNCGVPCSLKEFNEKKYWRCSKKNIWNKLTDFVDTLGFKEQNSVDPCNFYLDVLL
mgnify:CR=1 FL=1|tara:strand:- start:1747 stop:2238 length:492 start_codon:yes stop_codon:yes gene_type:complete